MTKEQFKDLLKETVEKGQSVWCLLGAVIGAIGLGNDDEVTELAYKLIDIEMKK